MRLFGQKWRARDDTMLSADRVVLRRAQDGDWPAYANVRQASRAFLEPWEPTWPPDALSRTSFTHRVRRYAEDWQKDSGYSFIIFERHDDSNFGRSDDTLIGGIGVTNIRRGVAQAGTLGYWMGSTYAGRGLMGEALGAVLEFCFTELALHRVEAACLPHNERSKSLLKRHGFDQEGYAEKYLMISGEWRDHLLFGLRSEGWGP